MTLPVYGNPLGMQQIANEFSSGTVLPLSSYYAGGTYVPSGTKGYPSGGGATDIPSSGAISINNFYGSSKASKTNYKFNTPGTTNWTVPVGVTSIDYAIIGGGGGGGNTIADGSVQGGGGGAGGSFFQGTIAVTPGQVLAITPGNYGPSWTNGGDTTVTGAGVSLVAKGGQRGGGNAYGGHNGGLCATNPSGSTYNPGGTSATGADAYGGGGASITAAGGNGTYGNVGNGADGITFTLGAVVNYTCGGGGGGGSSDGSYGTGGAGGGGNGGSSQYGNDGTLEGSGGGGAGSNAGDTQNWPGGTGNFGCVWFYC